MVLLEMVEVVLVLGPPISPPQKIILSEIERMGGLFHLIVSAKHTPWRYLGVGIIQLVLMMVLYLVFLIDMVNVMWLLVPPTPPTAKIDCCIDGGNLCC